MPIKLELWWVVASCVHRHEATQASEKRINDLAYIILNVREAG